MKQIELNEATLLDTAQAVANSFKSKGVKGAGKMRCLQALCQHFYSKPYEELQKTIFSEQTLPVSNHSHCRVVILRYTTEMTVLTMDGEFIQSFCEDTYFGNNGFLEAQRVASVMASANSTSWRSVALPLALSEDDAHDESNIVELAHSLQIFDYKKTLFEQLSDDDISILINRNICPYTLNGDMDIDLQESDEHDVMDTCIWYAETTDKSGKLREYYFTLKEIASAKPAALPNRWTVNYSHDGKETFAVEIQVN